jgi:hypothetical protein
MGKGPEVGKKASCRPGSLPPVLYSPSHLLCFWLAGGLVIGSEGGTQYICPTSLYWSGPAPSPKSLLTPAVLLGATGKTLREPIALWGPHSCS